MEPMKEIPRFGFLMALALFVVGISAYAQRVRGELHVEVRDPQGAALAADAELLSEANQFHRTFVVGLDGRYVAQDLAFGIYSLSLRARGFAPRTDLIEIRSEVPVRISVTMALAPVETEVHVGDSA